MKGANMKRLNAKQAHKSNKFHKACVEVPTHAVLGGGAIL